MALQEIIQNRSQELLAAINQVGDAISQSVNILVKEGRVDVDTVANSFIRLGELSYTLASEIILTQKEGAEELLEKITKGQELEALRDKIVELEKEIQLLKKNKS